MGSSMCPSPFIIIFLLLLPLLASSGPIINHSITPNFTATNFEFIDQSGDFLESLNGTFKGTIANIKDEPAQQCYFSVVHVTSNTIIWSANPNSPISQSAELSLTPQGLSITNETNHIIWSTPKLASAVASLQLLETGNLLLLDAKNTVLWQSFDNPTDTIVSGQRLRVGQSLSVATTPGPGAAEFYRLTVTDEDVVMEWQAMSYWMLSMESAAYKDTNAAVAFMAVNSTGLHLLAADGSTSVMKVALEAWTGFRTVKVGNDGKLIVSKLLGEKMVQELSTPSDGCQAPFVCGKLGLCIESSRCSCPTGFVSNSKADSDFRCLPIDKSLALPTPPSSCTNATLRNSQVSYLKLSSDIDYFAVDLTPPSKEALNLSICQDLCSRNCSCFAFFHDPPSDSCYLLHNQLASLRQTQTSAGSVSESKNQRVGYIKALVVGLGPTPAGRDEKSGSFPVAALVLLPTTGLFVIVGVALLATLWLKRRRPLAKSTAKLRRWNSSSSAEMEDICIPGLPVRFDYEELAAATDNFKTQIGSGGFGTVYKGSLADKSVVAVKKISSLGIRGKKDFYTEMSIIGNIHHVNLVKLKGFCAEGRQRFLVLEFMNRGSLDGALFGEDGPVLEWNDRFEIALGTARGLAYLHSGCQHKIIHCDVKPENILLHDNCHVKISDFGLSKLLSPEESSMFTTMRGTRGYLAPEWLANSSISDKADVYSYGMVLLEIVRGKKNSSISIQSNSSSSNNGGGSSSTSTMETVQAQAQAQAVYFPLMALEMHEQKRYRELVDPRLGGRASEEEIAKAVKIALCCLQEDPALRPSMATVVSMLEGVVAVADPRLQSLNFLRFYGRRFVEESHVSTEDHNEFVMWKSGTTTSYNSLSYISSHHLSGPR